MSVHAALDRTAPEPPGQPETSAAYGFGCLACGGAMPVGRRGPMPTYCRRCAKRLQNLRARSGHAADPRSPVPRQCLAARAELLRSAIRNAHAELAEVERRQVELERLSRDLDRTAEETRRHALPSKSQSSSPIPGIVGKNA